jgi:hypothetical protein
MGDLPMKPNPKIIDKEFVCGGGTEENPCDTICPVSPITINGPCWPAIRDHRDRLQAQVDVCLPLSNRLIGYLAEIALGKVKDPVTYAAAVITIEKETVKKMVKQ